jgi:hypothetical protein
MKATEFIIEGVAGPKNCWPGYRKTGTQPGTGKNKGKRVNDCEKIKEDDVEESGLQYYTGVKKHGKEYMTKAAQLARDGASQEELGRLKDRLSKAHKGKAKNEGVAEASALEKFRQGAAEREKKHDAAEKEMKARHARGEEDMKGSIDRLEKHINTKESVEEAAKKGLYYYVNKRKKAGTSRDASHPKAPTAQAWKDAAKTAKKEDIDLEEKWTQKYKNSINCSNPKGFSQKAHCAGKNKNEELEQEFDLIESIIEQIADQHAIDVDLVWEDLSTLTDDELYVFAVTSEIVNEDWQKANKRDKTDGMSKKAVNAYRRENPGSKLKTAVTTKPSKLKRGSKASKRRKSYCSRSRGQMSMHNISCAKTPDKAICKARRRWNC